MKNKISLFEYNDYRHFLRDWFEAKKAEGRGYSYRVFSRDAGFSSPNFLKLVMTGERNLTEKSLVAFAKSLKLNKQEQEYFSQLVHFNQSENTDQKNKYLKNCLQIRNSKKIRPIEKDQYEYFSQWYHAALREILPGTKGNVQELAALLQFKISESQIQKSMELLASLGLVSKNEKGVYSQTDRLLTTGAELRATALMSYHQKMLDLTKAALNEIPPYDRDVSALTLGIKKNQLPQLKLMIQEFRQKVLQLASQESTECGAEEVVQMNIQMFPLTKIEEAKKEV